MRDSEGPFGGEPIETESRRLTPSQGLDPADSSNEDFLFHLYRGSELLQDNRVHEAKEELERALHLQPRDSKGQDLLAVVYFRLGLHARAIQIYEQLRRRNPNDPALLLNLSLCYLKTGQPQSARRDLEQLLTLNPTHARAWGYLGLACERLGDMGAAERAFQQGGHGQMAKRLASRREGGVPNPTGDEPEPSQAVRAVAGAAYRELDAGELTFALADSTTDRSDAAGQSWRPIELGQVRVDDAKPDPNQAEQVTRDVPVLPVVEAPVQAIPHLGLQQTANRRPTLIAPVGAPPAHDIASTEFAALGPLPSQKPPTFTLDDAGAPSIRRPVVSVPRPYNTTVANEAALSREASRPRVGTLAPPHGTPNGPRAEIAEPVPQAPPPVPSATQAPSTPLGIGPRREREPEASVPDDRPLSLPQSVRFPPRGVELHRSGVALVLTTDSAGFAARLESIRAQQSGVKLAILERHTKGRPNGESFGGVASPMVLTTGAGQLVLAPRPGRKLFLFGVENEMCFTREDVLLGFGADLGFENGRLAAGDGEYLPIVQLKGTGAVLLECLGEALTLPVYPHRSLHVRREVVLGWFGRLVPRAVPASDAPCGQRGLVSFAGEGRVLITSM